MPPPTNGGSSIAISPDGTKLVYASGTPPRLFLRRLDQPPGRRELPGTENGSRPIFSPDGQWVGFVARGKLNKISVEGGGNVVLADIGNFAGWSWGDDGSIIVSRGGTSQRPDEDSSGWRPARGDPAGEGSRNRLSCSPDFTWQQSRPDVFCRRWRHCRGQHNRGSVAFRSQQKGSAPGAVSVPALSHRPVLRPVMWAI